VNISYKIFLVHGNPLTNNLPVVADSRKCQRERWNNGLCGPSVGHSAIPFLDKDRSVIYALALHSRLAFGEDGRRLFLGESFFVKKQVVKKGSLNCAVEALPKNTLLGHAGDEEGDRKG